MNSNVSATICSGVAPEEFGDVRDERRRRHQVGQGHARGLERSLNVLADLATETTWESKEVTMPRTDIVPKRSRSERLEARVSRAQKELYLTFSPVGAAGGVEPDVRHPM